MEELIAIYDADYPEKSHIELAQIIKDNEKLSQEIRTLRRHISHYRSKGKEKRGLSPETKDLTEQDIRDIFNKILEEQKHEYLKWNAEGTHVKDDATDKVPEKETVTNNWHFTTPGDYLVLGCVHAPFHNQRFLDALMNLCKDKSKNFAGLILNGDFLDMNSLSAHDAGKLPIPGVTLGWEYHIANIVLDQLEDVFGDKEKGFIEGNHEDRYWRAIQKPDHWKLTGELRRPADALGLYGRGFNFFEDWQNDSILLGNDLEIMHGIYTSQHVAKRHVDQFGTNVMFAHCHRIQSYHAGNSGYAIGAGADFTHRAFNYANRAMKLPWENGAAIVHVDEDGEHFVNQLRFKSEKIYCDGRTYAP